jgi:peptidoglycan hydrolase-like protein with peptidoglycan-binding domain
MLLKKGSKGKEVKQLQEALNIGADGIFGSGTEKAVIQFQKDNGLVADGIVGSKTWESIGIDTDQSSNTSAEDTAYDKDNKLAKHGTYTTKDGLVIDKVYLDSDEYVRDYGKIEPLGFFIHHTAGWDNPYNTVSNWNRDKRGRVATQYVIGGSNVKGKESKYDGTVVECFPDNYLGWHLGKVGKFVISKMSGGVELNNFGYLKKKGDKYYTYVNTEVKPEFVCDLGYKFRGHQYWHAYTDKQIESLRLLILHLRDIYPKMDLVNGIPKLLKAGVHPNDAFEFNEDAYYARQFGLWSHTNVRKDKFDCFPQPELVEMLKQL